MSTVAAMRAHERRRSLSVDEMPAAAAAPRVTLLAAIMLGGATYALLLLDSAGPYGILLGPALRPVAWLALRGGLSLAAAAAVEWGRAARGRSDSAYLVTRKDLRAFPPERFA